VLLVGYEWLQVATTAPPVPSRSDRGSRTATGEEVGNLLSHLVERRETADFFLPPEKRPLMERNLRNIFTRAELTEQEVRTLHGVLTALSGEPRKARPES
jgi:tRNA/rRNA methyltransferase